MRLGCQTVRCCALTQFCPYWDRQLSMSGSTFLFSASQIKLEIPLYSFHSNAMSVVRKTIHVDYDLRVFFTDHAFEASNLVLKQAMANKPGQVKKVLLILDESLSQTQPNLARQIERYFAAHANVLKLVCHPLVIEG